MGRLAFAALFTLAMIHTQFALADIQQRAQLALGIYRARIAEGNYRYAAESSSEKGRWMPLSEVIQIFPQETLDIIIKIISGQRFANVTLLSKLEDPQFAKSLGKVSLANIPLESGSQAWIEISSFVAMMDLMYKDGVTYGYPAKKANKVIENIAEGFLEEAQKLSSNKRRFFMEGMMENFLQTKTLSRQDQEFFSKILISKLADMESSLGKPILDATLKMAAQSKRSDIQTFISSVRQQVRLEAGSCRKYFPKR